MDAHRALTDARAALAAAAERLAAAGATPEQLATTVPAHRVWGVVPRRETFRRTGEAFLLGALLITPSGDVFEPGRIVRASRQVLPGHQSESARARRELRQRLLDARLPEGSTVVIDARPLPLDDAIAMAAERGPLVLRSALAVSVENTVSVENAERDTSDARDTSDTSADTQLVVRWVPSAPDSALLPLTVYLAERCDLALTALASARSESEHP